MSGALAGAFMRGYPKNMHEEYFMRKTLVDAKHDYQNWA
jgi:hypothetical protein